MHLLSDLLGGLFLLDGLFPSFWLLKFPFFLYIKLSVSFAFLYASMFVSFSSVLLPFSWFVHESLIVYLFIFFLFDVEFFFLLLLYVPCAYCLILHVIFYFQLYMIDISNLLIFFCRWIILLIS